MSFKKYISFFSFRSFYKSILISNAATLFMTSHAMAEYPERAITLVVPFLASSVTDIVGRIFAQEIGKSIGQPVIVDNRPEANATIETNHVKRATPDRYTILMATNAAFSVAPWLMKNIPYNPLKDFTPIARSGDLPFMLVSNPNRPYQTIQQLLQYTKDHPGQISYASGNGIDMIAAATLDVQAGMKALHVLYTSSPQALTYLIAGQVDFMFTDITSGLQFIKNGRIKALAVSTA